MTNVLFATSEVYPLAKTGGLADVSASLPRALCELGHQVHVLLPGYTSAMSSIADWGMKRLARLSVRGHAVTLWESSLPGTPVVLWIVDVPALFDRPGTPYQDSDGHDWPDNAQRFHLFAEVAVLLAMDEAGLAWRPDLVHCNDWQAGLIPPLLAHRPNRPASVFTVHNLAYHGLFPYETFQNLGLPEELWRFESLEFHGQFSFIKGGLTHADRLTTVSPSYAREIQTPEYGHGLDGLLRHRQGVLSGILNGIDEQVWDPGQDAHLPAHYGLDGLEGKAICKQELQQSLGLANDPDQPLLGFIGRLADQKGVDLIIETLPDLLERGCQIVVLGAGSHDLERSLRERAGQHPGRIAVAIGHDEGLAHRITAGADIFLMPSRFEPCGLNQMYSLRYGTVPVVHGVGGLRDTVFDPAETRPEEANGFSFHAPTATALGSTLMRCLEAYRSPAAWTNLQRNGMSQDFSWLRSAQAYGEVYRLALLEREHPGTP